MCVMAPAVLQTHSPWYGIASCIVSYLTVRYGKNVQYNRSMLLYFLSFSLWWRHLETRFLEQELTNYIVWGYYAAITQDG